MNAYFDISNLKSFIRTIKTDEENYHLCFNMLKRFLHVHISANKEQIENDPILQMWSTLWGQGCVNTIKLDDSINYLYNLDNIGMDSNSAVYMLESEQASDSAKKGNHMICGVGGELNLLLSLFIDYNQFSCPINTNAIIQEGWECLSQYTRPCTDLIIADPYLFDYDGDKDHQFSLYERNSFKLINILSNRLAQGSHLNIVFFTNKEMKLNKRDGQPLQNPLTISLRESCPQIRNSIKEELATRGIDCSVSFVMFQKSPEHDRIVFTNYVSFFSGSSLNYFLWNGRKATRGREFTIKSLAYSNNYESAYQFVKSLKYYIRNIQPNSTGKGKSITGEIDLDSNANLNQYLSITPKEGEWYKGLLSVSTKDGKNVFYIKCQKLFASFRVPNNLVEIHNETNVQFTLSNVRNEVGKKEWVVNSIKYNNNS